jgi:hypothetical protein
MATTAQLVAIYASRLRIPQRRAAWHAEKLRALGLLPSTQGKPTAVDLAGAAALLLATIVGGMTPDSGDRIPSYMALREAGWGKTLEERLAEFVGGAPGLYEARFNVDVPAAVLLIASGPSVYPERYTDPDAEAPAFRRWAEIDGHVIKSIATDIAAAPEVRPGRRTRKDSLKL